MDLNKLLSDMQIGTEKPIDPSFVWFAMLIELYKTTNDKELKKVLEQQFIKMLTIIS